MNKARIKNKRDLTENWNKATSFIPLEGEIIIYTDYSSYETEEYGEKVTKYIPNIKIGDGKAYVTDLPFIDKDLRDKLLKHIEDEEIHVTLGEKAFWNNKVNIDDAYETIHEELVDETLIFNRN